MPSYSDTETEPRNGLRTRARSLSNTLGGLLGVGRRKRMPRTEGYADAGGEDTEEGEGTFISRSQSHSGTGVADT